MRPGQDAATLDDARAEAAFAALIQRLVNDTAGQRALAAGEVDALVDPGTGRAVLLPALQQVQSGSGARYGTVHHPITGGHWTQDDRHRFVACAGTVVAGLAEGGADALIGRALWDLPFENMTDDDWHPHRQRLEWRVDFHDLTLRRTDAATGRERTFRLDGEPVFDPQGLFRGYTGTVHEVTEPAHDHRGGAGTALQALATRICVLDPAGTVALTNAAWRAFADLPGCIGSGVHEGVSFLAACERAVGAERADGLAMAAGIRQVIAGERALFRYEYACDRAEGPLWFIATVTPEHGPAPRNVVFSYDDVTDLERARRLLKLQYRVARCLADADTETAALEAVISAVCATQHWECGRYFDLHEPSGLLRVEASWGISAPDVERFMEKSRGVAFRPTAGLAGRVYESGQPLWVLNGAGDASAAQDALAHETGMNGAFDFPVFVGDRTLGVLAFAGHAIGEPDVRLLQAVHAIGNQVGRYLVAHRDVDRVRRNEARLRRLLDLTCDWTWEQDAQFRFTRVSGGGIAGSEGMLGRTLWELPTLRASEDEWVRHRSEVAAHWSFCDFEIGALQADGEVRYYSLCGEPTYDDANVCTGFQGTGLDITPRKLAELALRGGAG